MATDTSVAPAPLCQKSNIAEDCAINAMRAEFKRHSKNPQWPLVKSQISGPLVEVRNRVAEELARREKSDSLVPIDRDPVPGKYSDLVRRYYEKLGNEESR